GPLYWSVLRFAHRALVPVASASSGRAQYLAATLVKPWLVAGVTTAEVHWLRGAPGRLYRQATSRLDLPSAVACFPSHATNELIVIGSDGVVVRAPVPA